MWDILWYNSLRQQKLTQKGSTILPESNFAVFVDLENCGAKVDTLENILEKVKIRGDILLGKVYGYTDRFSALKEVLLSNTFSVVPSLRYGISQKNNADIQLVLDATEVAYTNPLIDSFCIVSGDSDYTPLVGKLKSMGKFVLGISRSEVASKIFINACNEFQFLETVTTRKLPMSGEESSHDDISDIDELYKLIENIIGAQSDTQMHASELKKTLLRLRPDFNEKNYGCNSFGKLIEKLASLSYLKISKKNNVLVISLVSKQTKEAKEINKANWIECFSEQLQRYKSDGYERINPSIIKADIVSLYPDFSEKSLGFKRFSDMLKELNKQGILSLEMKQKNLLVKIL